MIGNKTGEKLLNYEALKADSENAYERTTWEKQAL